MINNKLKFIILKTASRSNHLYQSFKQQLEEMQAVLEVGVVEVAEEGLNWNPKTVVQNATPHLRVKVSQVLEVGHWDNLLLPEIIR